MSKGEKDNTLLQYKRIVALLSLDLLCYMSLKLFKIYQRVELGKSQLGITNSN